MFLSTGTAWQINAAAVLNPGQPMSSANMSSPNCTLAATQQWVNGQPVGAIKCFQDLYKQYQYVVGISENDSISNSAISQQTAFFVDLIMQTANTMCTLNFTKELIDITNLNFLINQDNYSVNSCNLLLTAFTYLLKNDYEKSSYDQMVLYGIQNSSNTSIYDMNRISQSDVNEFTTQLQTLKKNNVNNFMNYVNQMKQAVLFEFQQYLNMATTDCNTSVNNCQYYIYNLFGYIQFLLYIYGESVAMPCAKDLIALINQNPKVSLPSNALEKLKNIANNTNQSITQTAL